MTGLPPEPNSFKIKNKIKCIINIDSSTMQIFYWFLYCLKSLDYLLQCWKKYLVYSF
jgi:hypothetical protein